jgi:ABC-2 type transport system permease protein
MNIALYRAMLKQHSKTIFGFAIGSSLFLLMETLIYPSIEEAVKAKMEMFDTLPEGMKAAFGMENGLNISSVLDLLSIQYYSLIFLVLLALFTISTANKLLSHFVEQGSMAYLLSAPVSRKKVVGTMIGVFLTGLFLIVACNFLFTYGGSLLVEKAELDLDLFFKINALGFLLFFAIGGYSFFFSSLFTEERHVLAFAGGLTLVFYILDMVGKVNDKFEDVRMASIFALFQPSEIIADDMNFAAASLILFGIGLVGYILSVAIFQKKNLPL